MLWEIAQVTFLGFKKVVVLLVMWMQKQYVSILHLKSIKIPRLIIRQIVEKALRKHELI